MCERRTNPPYVELALRELTIMKISNGVPHPIVPLFRTHELTALTFTHMRTCGDQTIAMVGTLTLTRPVYVRDKGLQV